MQRKPSYYLKKSVVTVLAAATGLVVGLQMETTRHERSNAEAYFGCRTWSERCLYRTPWHRRSVRRRLRGHR